MAFSWEPLEPRYAAVSDQLCRVERIVVEVQRASSVERRRTFAKQAMAAIADARVALDLLLVQVRLVSGGMPDETAELRECVARALDQVQERVSAIVAPVGLTAHGGCA